MKGSLRNAAVARRSPGNMCQDIQSFAHQWYFFTQAFVDVLYCFFAWQIAFSRYNRA
jgi:hypothetical protein